MGDNSFSFHNHWYALVLSKEIKNTEPYGIKLLGEPLVLYRDKQQTVHCLVDSCPHRSTKLSEGIMVDGKLECKYHGWQFGKDGDCVHIPSLPEGSSLSNYCATSYSVTERWGLVWVFRGDKKLADINKLPFHLFTEYEDPNNWIITEGFRDFDIDHGLMIENLLDPAHLPFTHVGTLAKREQAEPMAFEILYDNLFDKEKANNTSHVLFPKGVYGIQGEVNLKTRPKQIFAFQAPCAVRIDLPTSRKKKLIQILFCIPITPTKMRLNFVFVRDFAKFLQHFPGHNRIFQYSSDKVTDQDVELLLAQQSNLIAGAKEFNTSVPADKVAVRYRRWRKITEENENSWFTGFNSEVTDIEDLVPSNKSSYDNNKNTKNKQLKKRVATQNEILEAGGGGKDYRSRPRISFFAPEVKWYALGFISAVVSVCVLYARMRR